MFYSSHSLGASVTTLRNTAYIKSFMEKQARAPILTAKIYEFDRELAKAGHC